MRFSQDFIQRVMEANNIVDIISQYTQLKPAGGGLMGRCPFPDHVEKTPSFSVSETKQVYHCFGCHKSGNLVTFLREYHGYAFPEAIEWLAHRASIPLPIRDNHSEQEDRANAKRKQLLELNREAARFFVNQLSGARPDHPVKQYIAQRGLTPETIDAFSIGYAPKEWDGLTQHFISKGTAISLAEEARLAVARKDARGGHFDMFRNRLMFPILNTMGDPVAFGGRVLDPADNPKYLNSPETPVFEKKKVLYGLHQTARHIRSEDVAVIVEGYMDAVSLFQAGLKNVAAVMSSSLTPEQARLLKRMSRNVIMLLDGDAAGMDGAERSLPILLNGDLYPRGVFLPDGMDPDDFVKAKGVDALRTLLDQSQDLLFVVLDRWMEGYRGEPAEKLKLADKVKPILNGVADARLKNLYIEDVARRLGVQISWLRDALEGGARPAANPPSPRPVSPPRVEKPAAEPSENTIYVIAGAPAAELSALALALKSRANFEIFAHESSLENFSYEGVKAILQEALRLYGQEPDRFDRLTSLLVTSVDQPGLLFPRDPFALKDAQKISETDKAEMDQRMLRDALKRVRETRLRQELKKLSQELVRESTPDKLERLAGLQRDISSLTKGS